MLRAIRSRFDSCQNKVSDESIEPSTNVRRKDDVTKLPWYYASGFLFFWGLLFFAIVIPFFYRLPTALTTEDEHLNVFIAERAYKNLYTLSKIGTKLTGSRANEIEAVNFIQKELKKIKEDLLEDYFDIEIDVSQASGAFVYSTMLNMYQGVQNIAVKLTPKNSTSESYLLVNSHFDSKPFTPSAGDAGFMIVTMLEVLKVIATTKQTFEHPIVFLFNGAEEGGLQASHGFVTQHKWASHCKAVVNLDAGGSGGREILFQSGPGHPWLVDYYRKHIKHPFATTMGEEIFQSGIIPSDTDFRQFNLFGNIPGLDLAQCINGFIYHTKYDTIDVISHESLQNTGENVLSLVRGLANATELHNTEAHRTGHAVFFDFLGVYFVHYSQATGIFLNLSISAAGLILIFLSLWRMAVKSDVVLGFVVRWFILVFILQLFSVVLGLVLPIVVALVFDSLGLSLTYYSTPWLVICLYVCPSLIGLSLPMTIFYSLQRNDKISASFQIQLALHAQAVILTFIAVGLTACGIRSSYIFIIPLVFYVGSLLLNLMTTLHDRDYAWTGLVKAGQLIPFLYSSYLFYLFIVVLTPIGGRSGSASNRDVYIAVLAAVGSVLSFGFLMPLINTLRRPSVIVFILLTITAVGMYLAGNTHMGFPYRAKTNGMRVAYLHVRNMFYESDGTLSKDESGYLFSFQDRREEKLFLGTNLTGLISIKSKCERQMMCGMPLFDYRYTKNRLQSKWLPRSDPVEPPEPTTLMQLNTTILDASTIRFEFELTGPSHMSLFIQPFEDVTITNWSFLQSYLEKPPESNLPYHIYLTYGNDSSPLNFFLELSKWDGDFSFPSFQLGVSGHYIEAGGDEQSRKFAALFPSYSILADWPVLYQRYIF